MKLNVLLTLLVCLAGLLALLLSIGLILYTTDQAAQQRVNEAASGAQSNLEFQKLKWAHQLYTLGNFPDFELWQRAEDRAGLCIHYDPSDDQQPLRWCLGTGSDSTWPSWFESVYTQLFTPGKSAQLPIRYEQETLGFVNVSSDPVDELAQAWTRVRDLSGLSFLIVITLSLMLYATMRRVLWPVKQMQSQLATFMQGDWSTRVPDFHIQEWQTTGTAINTLANKLESTLAERQQLTLKLMDLQEQERRHLSRELHDELGQSLAGLSAVASTISDEAKHHSPSLQQSADQVSRISRHMMASVKDVLLRLRPADLDQLGLTDNLHGMVAEWNKQHIQTQCHLKVTGDEQRIDSAVAVSVLRIIQESLTNVSKHAQATQVSITLDLPNATSSSLALNISDDGNGGQRGIIDQPGMGLLGIRERVQALNGHFNLGTREGGGLALSISLPGSREADHD